MRNEQHYNSDVNVRRIEQARERAGVTSDLEQLQDTLLRPQDAESFPYLENLMAAARKYPYAALGAMITVAGIVIAAIVTVAVSVFTGMFLMYGTMKETTTNQIQIQNALIAIQKQQTDDGNAIRAYESNRARRTEFIVGLMSPENQKAIAQWDAVNPAPELPKPNPKE